MATSAIKIIQQNMVTCDLVLKPQSRQTQHYKQIANWVNGLGDESFLNLDDVIIGIFLHVLSLRGERYANTHITGRLIYMLC
jgi:hypothetical protein